MGFLNATKYKEHDGSVTLSLAEMDLVVNEADEEKAKLSLAEDIKEYANDFYNEYLVWSSAPNRKSHIPYVSKALDLDAEEIAKRIIVQ